MAQRKPGVVAFARTLALEEARYGITVNVIEPGDIRDTDGDARRSAAHQSGQSYRTRRQLGRHRRRGMLCGR